MKILLISDIHANFRALQAVLDFHSDADEIWCLGDIVEFGPCPSECVDLVRQNCQHVVKGNHDVSYASAESSSVDNIWAREREPTDVAWLLNLPSSLTVACDGFSNYLVHATPQDNLRGNLWPNDEPAKFADALQIAATDRVFCGHTHMAFIYEKNGRYLTNPGTVGQPRDGDYRAQCAVIDNGKIQFERVDYDIEALRLDYSRSSLPDDVKKDWFRYTMQGVVDQHGLQLGPFSVR